MTLHEQGQRNTRKFVKGKASEAETSNSTTFGRENRPHEL